MSAQHVQCAGPLIMGCHVSCIALTGHGGACEANFVQCCTWMQVQDADGTAEDDTLSNMQQVSGFWSLLQGYVAT